MQDKALFRFGFPDELHPRNPTTFVQNNNNELLDKSYSSI